MLSNGTNSAETVIKPKEIFATFGLPTELVVIMVHHLIHLNSSDFVLLTALNL